MVNYSVLINIYACSFILLVLFSMTHENKTRIIKMLTTQEQNTLQFIRNYIAQFGYAPKFKEIGSAIGVNSQGTIHRYVQSLEDKGYINRAKGNSRGMSLIDLPLVSPPVIPLVGKIAAGMPIEAIQNQETIDMTSMFTGPGRYALRVSGDSMIDEELVQECTTACGTGVEQCIQGQWMK